MSSRTDGKIMMIIAIVTAALLVSYAACRQGCFIELGIYPEEHWYGVWIGSTEWVTYRLVLTEGGSAECTASYGEDKTSCYRGTWRQKDRSYDVELLPLQGEEMSWPLRFHGELYLRLELSVIPERGDADPPIPFAREEDLLRRIENAKKRMAK